MEKFISDPCSKSWFVGVSSIYTLYPFYWFVTVKTSHEDIVLYEGITESGGLQIDPKDAKLKFQDLVVDEPENDQKSSEMFWI